MGGFVELFIVLITARSFYCTNHLAIHREKSLDLAPAVAEMITKYYATKGSYFHIVEAVDQSDSFNKFLFDDIIAGVLRRTSLPLEIEDYTDIETPRNQKRFSVIIFIDSIKSFNIFIAKVSSKNFKLRRQFTVIPTNHLDMNEVQQIFNSFWNIFIKFLNLVRQNENGIIELLTFFPFNEQTCGDTQPIVINTFDANRKTWENDIFQPSKTKNLFNCTLIIGGAIGTSEPNFMATFDSNGKPKLAGVEYDIFIQLSEQLNFNPRFETYGNFVGLLYDNGTASGELISSSCHLS